MLSVERMLRRLSNHLSVHQSLSHLSIEALCTPCYCLLQARVETGELTLLDIAIGIGVLLILN